MQEDEKELIERIMNDKATKEDLITLRVKTNTFLHDLVYKKEKLSDTDKELIRRIMRLSPKFLKDNLEQVILEKNIVDLAGGYQSDGIIFLLKENFNQLIEQFNGTNRLEEMLILHIVMCWINLLRHHWLSAACSNIESVDKEFTSSQKRFLKACETLAKIRKSDLKLQINIAQSDGKQIIL